MSNPIQWVANLVVDSLGADPVTGFVLGLFVVIVVPTLLLAALAEAVLSDD